MNSVYRASQRARVLGLLRSHSFSTKPRNPKPTSESRSEWTRPSEIPYQAKVANSVRLIGYVQSPIQFRTASDGSSWAATVITQNFSSNGDDDGLDDSPDSLPLWVPVIFEGDLAHIAASHLKEKDRVFVSGFLSSSLPRVNGSQVQATVQVMVNDFNFIGKTPQKQKKILDAFIESEKETCNLSESASKKEDPVLSLWMDLVDNPKQWWDNREAKKNRTVSLKYPDFKHKERNQVLWLNRAPKSILNKLRGLEFDAPIQKSKDTKQSKDSKDLNVTSWKDLLERTKEWNDYRNSKLNGQVSQNHPDFKRKDGTGRSLWLNNAPQWILSNLEGLEFDVQVQQPKEGKDGNVEEQWKDLVENPNQWWDNREGKSNKRAPDFKHKKTGAGLWLVGSPAWVSSKLPPPKDANGDEAKWNR